MAAAAAAAQREGAPPNGRYAIEDRLIAIDWGSKFPPAFTQHLIMVRKNNKHAASGIKQQSCKSRGNLATNLQLARTILKLSQEQLGLRCGLKRTYIGTLERGEMNPGIDNLDRIASGIGVDSHVLILSPDQACAVLYRVLGKPDMP